MKSFLYQLRDITYSYDQEFELKLKQLDIPQGGIYGITGANGSGKTTLLKLLSFLLPIQSGSFKYRDQQVTSKSLVKLRKQVTMLFQDNVLLQRSVFDNIAYGLKVRKDINDLQDRVSEALDLVGLESTKFAARNYQQLSGGERKRVALASRLILKPQVLLLDEPMMNIDKQSWRLIIKVLEQLVKDSEMTIIVSGHDTKSLNNIIDKLVINLG